METKPIHSSHLSSGCDFEIKLEDNVYFMNVICGRSTPVFKISDTEIVYFTDLQKVEVEKQQEVISKIYNFYGKGSHTIKNNGEVI